MQLPNIHAIWIGQTLGAVHRACLLSFLRHGHDVHLHCYEIPEDVPAEVSLHDAGAILPKDRLLRYPNGSYAISSNLIRYRLLAQAVGLYVDCDVFCLEPIADADYIFGYETNRVVNTAVLKLPAGSPTLAELCAIDDGWLPPWRQPSERLPLAEYAWGATGPRALSHYVRQHGIEHLASPIDVFYPVHHQQTALLLDPALSISDITTSRTRYLHLYSNSLQQICPDAPPKGSPLDELLSMSKA
jgi:hypothetical protein